MKYQLRMIVDVHDSTKNPIFKLEDWMISLPIEIAELLDFGLAETQKHELDKEGSWE